MSDVAKSRKTKFWHISFLTLVVCFGGITRMPNARAEEKEPVVIKAPLAKLEFSIQLDTIMSGFDGKTCWVAPRAGMVPGARETQSKKD